MKRIWPLIALAFLAVALTTSLTVVAAQAPKAENQPAMNAAMQHLQEAQKNLEGATHDKGGHRVKAIGLIKQAMSEVEKGIQYDNTHTEKAEKPQPKHK